MRCLYVTQSWGLHDERWMEALHLIGTQPEALKRGELSDADLLACVQERAGVADVVLAGPLNSVTFSLRSLKVPVVGLSWGFDVPAMSDLRWLSSLGGVVVDCLSSMQALRRAGVCSDRITYLPWGVDIDHFAVTGAARRPPSVPANARILLSLRAHEPIYRVATAIEAFDVVAKGHPELHLVIGHSGSKTQLLRERAAGIEASARVHFIGSVDELDLPALLRASHCYISCSDVDGTSVTLLQAMACGVPVVVSNVGGNPDWVEHGVTGYLYPAGDVAAASNAIEQALDGGATVGAARSLVEVNANWDANLTRLRRALSVAQRSPRFGPLSPGYSEGSQTC